MKSIQTLQALLAASLVAALAACGSSAPSSPAPVVPAADTSAPSIVSVVPANGATGVLNDANIVITFSEPMNKLTTQSAYQSANSGILPSQVQFTWNTEGTILTINPNSILGYNSGSDPATVNAREYAYQITNVATDLAGNPLTTASQSFKTLRRLNQFLPGIATLSGYVRGDSTSGSSVVAGDSGSAANAQYKAFVSFDLSGVPAGVQSFEEASLYMNQTGVSGAPYPSLGAVQLEHLSFSARDMSAFNMPALHSFGTLSSTATAEIKTANVLSFVQEDYAQRLARSNRTQYRLAFPTISNFNGIYDAAVFATPTTATDPSALFVRYLVP